MSLQAAIVAELPGLRAQAESRMTSRATVRRLSSRATQDESTGLEVPMWDVAHADLPCRVGGADRGGSGTSRTEVAGVEIQTATRTVHFPATTTDLADGDLIEVTSGEIAGAVFRVIEADRQDQATARRVPVIATDRPEEW